MLSRPISARRLLVAFGERRERSRRGPPFALRALAFKWIRVLHCCWTDRIHYDEARYLSLSRSTSAEGRRLAAELELIFLDGPPQGESG